MKFRRTACLLLFLVLGVPVAMAAPPPPDHLTPEQLQQAVERMRVEMQLGKLPPLTEEMRKALQTLKPEQLQQTLDEMRGNPAFEKMLKDRGLQNSQDIPKLQDPRLLESLRKSFEKNTPKRNGLRPPGDGMRPPFDPGFQEPPRDRPAPAPRPQIAPPGLEEPDIPRPSLDRPNDFSRGIEPNRPLTARDQQRERRARNLAKQWERVLGPLDDNPAVRKAIMDMVLAGEDLKGPEGSDFWKYLEDNAGTEGGEGFRDFLDGLEGLDGNWDLPRFDLSGLDFGDWNFSGSNGAGGSPGAADPSPSLGRAFGVDWMGDSWLPVIGLVAVALLGLLLWRFRGVGRREPESRVTHPGLGPWPVDPRSLASREDVIKAFEYLTLLRCGDGSRSWNHVTIALALASLADEDSATQVARLYAQARYAPIADEFSPRDLADARHHISRLAGVATA